MPKTVRATCIDPRHVHMYGPETCARCQEENATITLSGDANCNYCGNEINLCPDCATAVAQDLLKLTMLGDTHDL